MLTIKYHGWILEKSRTPAPQHKDGVCRKGKNAMEAYVKCVSTMMQRGFDITTLPLPQNLNVTKRKKRNGFDFWVELSPPPGGFTRTREAMENKQEYTQQRIVMKHLVKNIQKILNNG